MELYNYAFSNASVRTRIVLYLKNISFKLIDIDLLQCQVDGRSFLELNPQGMVPTLVDGDLTLNQSLAIAEYLDEIFPTPALLPSDMKHRARVRSLALMIACDGQPIVNLRVRRYLRTRLKFSRQQLLVWMRHWLDTSLSEYETLIRRDSRRGSFSHGEDVTLADVFLVPQVLLARRFDVGLTKYPHVQRIYHHCLLLSAFQRAVSEYIIEDAEYGLDHPQIEVAHLSKAQAAGPEMPHQN